MPNGRQRALLAVLGIPQWIPRAANTRLAAPVALWRSADEQASNHSHSHNNSHSHQATAASESVAQGASVDVVVDLATVIDTAANPTQDSIPSEQVAHSTESSRPATDRLSEVRSPTARVSSVDPSLLMPDNGFNINTPDIKTDPRINESLDPEPLSLAPRLNFRLQACEINQWVILVNESDLQQPELRKLWHNILLAFKQPTVVHFSWPLSEGQRWQQAGGAKAALNGFLFRMGLDKRVGLMSNLPDDICPERLERLPHLAELLAEPLKKRTLWHLLKAQ